MCRPGSPATGRGGGAGWAQRSPDCGRADPARTRPTPSPGTAGLPQEEEEVPAGLTEAPTAGGWIAREPDPPLRPAQPASHRKRRRCRLGSPKPRLWEGGFRENRSSPFARHSRPPTGRSGGTDAPQRSPDCGTADSARTLIDRPFARKRPPTGESGLGSLRNDCAVAFLSPFFLSSSAVSAAPREPLFNSKLSVLSFQLSVSKFQQEKIVPRALRPIAPSRPSSGRRQAHYRNESTTPTRHAISLY
jgi:hypothetical protein